MKTIARLMVLCTLAVLVLAACGSGGSGGSPASAASPVSMKIGHTGNAMSKYQVGMEAFKADIDSKSGGRFTLEIFPMSLGGDRELLEGLQIGTVDFAEINTSVIANIVEELAVIDLPFIFTSVEHVNRVLDGPTGDEMIEMVNQRAAVTAVAWWENGFRCFTNNVRPIRSPADIPGLVMRTMQSNIHLETFRLWGANPTPMAFSEMLTAMQQRVIDGHDNNPDTIVTNNMWEFQNYFSESRHFFGAKMLIFSSRFWNALSDSDKTLFRNAAYLARDRERQESLARYEAAIDDLVKNGMNVIRNADVDTEAFIRSVQPVWDAFRAKHGASLIESIVKG